MSRLGGILLLLAAASAAGDSPSPAPAAPTADTGSIIFAPKPSSQAPEGASAPRPAGSGIGAEITRGLPTFKELGIGPPEVKTPEPDRPRNQIPRVPATMMSKYMVRESRLPVFRVLDLYTPEGLVQLSFKEHPGLRFGNLFNLNAKVAYDLIVDEQLRAERADLADTVRAMAIGGDGEDARLMQEALVEQAFLNTVTTRK